MKLQIEHSHSLLTQQFCVICTQQVKPDLARVIVCNNDGEAYGDICAHCLSLGSGFVRISLQHRLQPHHSA